jgi:hypothetical protein
MSAPILAGDDDRSFPGVLQSCSKQEPYTSIDYSQTLRVIGQVLESLKPEAFDTVCYHSCYLVRCRTTQTEKKLRDLARILRVWKDENPRPAGFGERPSMNLELLYTLKDIQLLEEQGKSRQRDPRGIPDPFSLSNILRAVGWFLNRESGCRLLLVSSHGHQIVVVYETAQGVRRADEYTTFTLYDFWVKMYVKKMRRFQPIPG